jgi:hypothetical protein
MEDTPRKQYPSDVTDEEWAFVAPYLNNFLLQRWINVEHSEYRNLMYVDSARFRGSKVSSANLADALARSPRRSVRALDEECDALAGCALMLGVLCSRGKLPPGEYVRFLNALCPVGLEEERWTEISARIPESQSVLEPFLRWLLEVIQHLMRQRTTREDTGVPGDLEWLLELPDLLIPGPQPESQGLQEGYAHLLRGLHQGVFGTFDRAAYLGDAVNVLKEFGPGFSATPSMAVDVLQRKRDLSSLPSDTPSLLRALIVVFLERDIDAFLSSDRVASLLSPAD